MKPKCFLLVEELILSDNSLDVYYGMSGAIVSRLAELKEMTREDKEAFGLRVRGSEWAHALVNNYSGGSWKIFTGFRIISMRKES